MCKLANHLHKKRKIRVLRAAFIPGATELEHRSLQEVIDVDAITTTYDAVLVEDASEQELLKKSTAADGYE